MKGQHYIFGLLFVLVLVIIFLLVSLPFLPNAKADFEKQGEPKLAQIVEYYESYQFNPEDLFVDPETASAATGVDGYFTPVDGISPYCTDFKNAFIQSIKSDGKSIIVKELDIVFPNTFSSSINLACNNLEIKETFAGTTRSICTVKPPFGTFTGSEDIQTQPFYDYEPYIHGCYIPNEFVSEIAEPKIFYYIYQPPYYIPTSDVNSWFTETGYSVRIVVSSASLGDGTDCAYHVFACTQPAISKSEDGVAYKIFKHFRETITNDMKCCKGVDNKVNSVYIHPYTFDFTDETDKPTLYQVLAATEAGLWEWNKVNFDNKNLIKNILNDNVPKDWEPKYIRFNYEPMALEHFDATHFAYPDCMYWSILDSPTITSMKNFYYDYYGWAGDRKDINYDKLSITSTFEYTIDEVDGDLSGEYSTDDAEDYQVLVITPHVSVCRNK